MSHLLFNKVLRPVWGVLPVCLFAFLPLNAQKVQVVNPKVNVGKTGFEVPVTATFELKATGSRHIHIEEVKPDCGCTKVEYPRKNISHGQTFTVSMTYDARMLGHFHKEAAVYVKYPAYRSAFGWSSDAFRSSSASSSQPPIMP